MNPEPIRLAVTLGDPRGIGPEVAIAAARALADTDDPPHLCFIGSGVAHAGPGIHELMVLGAPAGPDPVARAGSLAAAAIERAVQLALTGAVHGIVTAPIDKAALHAAGYPDPGHTEMLGRLTGARDPVMLMTAERTRLGGPLRVVLATTHLPLASVPAAFTTDLLVRQTRMLHAGLRDGWSIARPRIALCAFNPHASDGGRFGDEEERVYEPALALLRDADIDVTGPVPADTVFSRALRGEFDAVVAPYHDVGMAAFKTVSFGCGVNVTLGLPFIRTSPDHGTALDIAGRGLADAGSMIEAILLAQRLARTHVKA
jgi:4-hydroxythreonine-4-phosphate dehydrogenase